MHPLPVELIEDIIDVDFVAESCPESLPDCLLVSRRWVPRSTHHLSRIFRTPTITTVSELEAFTDIVKKHPPLALLATSLEVAPGPGLASAASSFMPFHHLSNDVLPNVHHLILGENLRWGDHPLAYRKIMAGFFDGVTILDLSCHFSSVSDLFLAIRLFKNVKDVRLVYPHDVPPRWMFYGIHMSTPRRNGAFFRETFKLQNLELSVSDH